MAIKTYETHKKSLTVGWPGPVGPAQLQFVDGKLSTESEDAQKFIEGLPSFKDGTIELSDPLPAARERAKSLRATADKAEAEAKAAESALAALEPKKAAAAAKA